jgi:hypothetical protein
MLGNLIGGFLTILVGTTLVPVVADSIFDVTHNSSGDIAGNITGPASTIVGLTTLFFVLGVTSAGIALATQGLRSAGIL